MAETDKKLEDIKRLIVLLLLKLGSTSDEIAPALQLDSSAVRAKKLKLILLDACRDNPFAPQMRRTVAPAAVAAAGSTKGGTVATRSVGRGLGAVKVSGATL